MLKKKNIFIYITAALIFFSAAVPSSAAGYAAGLSAGASGEWTGQFSGSITAGINFKSETVPLCFYGDAVLDLSEKGTEVLKSAEVSLDYFIASPVISRSFVHFFYGPEFAAGIYKNYFTDAGFCMGLSWFSGYDTELFFKAAFRAGVTLNDCNPKLNFMLPVKCGIKFYF
ncbi:MAG: hypothetical protein J6O39_02305 [Treponema sp.]|nr:hypothetical protein [Treponema sp.]